MTDSPDGDIPDRPPPPPSYRPPPPARHRSLDDLPPAVAGQVAFDKAAPRRLRSEKLPEEARVLFRDVWNGIVADIYDEVAGLRRTRLVNREVIERILGRVASRVQQAERALIVTSVYRPLRSDREWKHIAMGSVGGAASAAAEEVATFTSFGAGATVAVASAIVGELFETYVAGSARTAQYERVGRSPAPDVVVADLAQSSGLTAAFGRRASIDLSREAIRFLDEQLLRRTSKRFARGLLPIVGVAAGAGISGAGVRRVLKLPLRPPSEDELLRLAREVVEEDRARYAQDQDRFARLPPP